MGKYLIKLKPLEPYFFGGERTFGFGKKTKQKQPYYIVSEYIPSQPTLFGTLRYIVKISLASDERRLITPFFERYGLCVPEV